MPTIWNWSTVRVGASAAALACLGALSAPVAAQNLTYKEAPELAAKVAKGELPAVAQRLPSKPEVVKPLERSGNYGGQIRTALRGSADHNNILRLLSSQGLTRWNAGFDQILPNVAESWDASPDAKVLTFKLRAGLKWSDGEPMTADDVLFSMNDVFLNAEYAPPAARYRVSGQLVAVEKIDDLTVRFSFASANAEFLGILATPLGQHPVFMAKHYCSQFHPRYNKDVANLAKAENVPDWKALLLKKCGDIETPARWANPQRPTLDPWIVTEPYTGGASRVVMERNPYFWQVDPQGQQLPYIGRIAFSIGQDIESLNLQVIAGNIDFQVRHIDDPANLPLFSENKDKAQIEFVKLVAAGNDMILFPNLTNKNPVKRALYGQKNFRIALSLAIDRAEVIELAYLGQSEPSQPAPPQGHPLYIEWAAKQYLDYDPAKANKLLDELGLDKRDGSGFRVMADGKRLTIQVSVIPTFRAVWVEALEIIKRHLAKVGVEMQILSMERSLFFAQTSENNDHDFAVWNSATGITPGETPAAYMATTHDSRQGIPWANWYQSGGAKGEKPPASMMARYQLWDQARAEAQPDKRDAIFKQIIEAAATEFETIGIATIPPRYGIRKRKLVNVPAEMPNYWSYPTPGPTLLQTYFWTP